MCLTEYGLNERKWGPFPALRRILQNQPKSARVDGITSASDTVFEQFHRYLQIAAQANDNRSDLVGAASEDSLFAEGALRDLHNLIISLDALCGVIRVSMSEVEDVLGEVYRASQGS
jgi:hypothetical protein